MAKPKTPVKPTKKIESKKEEPKVKLTPKELEKSMVKPKVGTTTDDDLTTIPNWLLRGSPEWQKLQAKWADEKAKAESPKEESKKSK